MIIYRHTCMQCGLLTRVEDNQAWKACACVSPADVVSEDEPPPEPPPEPEPEPAP